jgi:outer membrane lipoprotein SlyB
MRGTVFSLSVVGFFGCQNKQENGALIGGAGGAVVGGAIGSVSHSSAGGGALIGAAVGAIGGAIVGNSLDQANENNDHQAEQEYDRRHSTDQWISKADVIDWTRRGVSDDVIIDRIQRSATVFHLTAADENDLRDHDVSEAVIRVMRDSAR